MYDEKTDQYYEVEVDDSLQTSAVNTSSQRLVTQQTVIRTNNNID